MAKLTDRQRNNILAKWHTGQFTKMELAKAYKVDHKTIRDVIGKEQPQNADVVEAGILLEVAKNSHKTPIQIQTINNAIKAGYDRLSKADEYKKKVDDIQLDLLDGIRTLLDKGTISRPMKLKNGDFDVIEQVEHDFTPNDYKTLINAVDDAAKTIGAVDRHPPKSDVNLTNAVQNVITPNELTKAISEALPD